MMDLYRTSAADFMMRIAKTACANMDEPEKLAFLTHAGKFCHRIRGLSTSEIRTCICKLQDIHEEVKLWREK